MNGLRRTFSFRKKKPKQETGDNSKPRQWLDDELKIKEGSCSFPVRYLGNIEVYESRGMQVCEEAIGALRKTKKKPQKAILYVSGDALRVSDDVSQHLIVDQTIEKVSFCAPDRSHEKGFAYICRDGATRRWMCHAFLAVHESGERLSHAVGCAFAICLEKKQKRERDALQLAASDDRSFTRVGSVRQASLAERLLDPQSVISAGNPVAPTDENRSAVINFPRPNIGSPRCPPASSSGMAGAIARPRPSPSSFERQGSLRLFPKLHENSPFKRDLSLRLEELPSNLRRLTRTVNGAAIPEEPSPEGNDCLTLVRSSASTPTTQSLTTNDLTSKIPNVTPPVTFGVSHSSHQSQSGSTLDTGLAATQSHSFSTYSPTVAASFVPSTSDPFSAAPFDPITSQYGSTSPVPPIPSKVAALTQLSISTNPMTTRPQCLPTSSPENLSTSAFMPAALHATVPTIPWSNTTLSVSQFPTILASTQKSSFSSFSSPPVPSVNWPIAIPAAASYSQSSYPLSSALVNMYSASSWLSNSEPLTTWSSSATSFLPPEPDRFADPFDVTWADRATASFSVTPSHKPGNPFLSATSPKSGTSRNVNGSKPSVPSDPALS